MKKGLKIFGKEGVDAIQKEMKQLHDMEVLIPQHKSDLSSSERRKVNNKFCCKKSWLQNTANKCDTSLAGGCSGVRGGGGDTYPPDR